MEERQLEDLWRLGDTAVSQNIAENEFPRTQGAQINTMRQKEELELSKRESILQNLRVQFMFYNCCPIHAPNSQLLIASEAAKIVLDKHSEFQK